MRKHQLIVAAFLICAGFALSYAGRTFAEGITISSDTTWQPGAYTYDNVLVTNGATLTFNGAVTLNAQNLTVDSGSSISSDGKGYPADQGPGAGKSANGSGGGGGYGGRGGNSGLPDAPLPGGLGGITYGSVNAPVDFGSGGGSGGLPGGAGGGAVRIIVFDALTLNGSITANGANGGGGGSGGSIYLTTQKLTGSGILQANGGRGGYWAGGSGGGGRIAVYYQTSSFSGKAEAKGEIAIIDDGEDGTVVIKQFSTDSPNTFFKLIEKSSTISTLSETLSTQSANLNNVTVTGGLNGTLNFTNLEFVTITTGVFSNKGFLNGEFETTLEDVSCRGSWRGMLYSIPVEQKIYLKGEISGELGGITDGFLTESVPGSGTYDKYQATWKLNRLGTDTLSATLNLEGTITSQSTHNFTSSLYIYQANYEGDAIGSYSGPLNAVLTHLRLTGENEYKGKGFSILSYNSLLGQGEGYSYNQVLSEGTLEFQGLFQSPLLGKLAATLDETKNPKTLSGTIERLDLGKTPAPDLKVFVWGPTRVSPGQTINNIIELRNDGLKEAREIELINELPFESKYLSNTGDGSYDHAGRDITWDFAQVGAKTKKYLSATQSINWGLVENTKIGQAVYLSEEKPVIDPTAKVEGTIIEATDNHAKENMIISNKDTSADFTIELTMAPISGEPPELILGQDVTAENVEYYGAITLDNTYIANTPFLVSYLRL